MLLHRQTEIRGFDKCSSFQIHGRFCPRNLNVEEFPSPPLHQSHSYYELSGPLFHPIPKHFTS